MFIFKTLLLLTIMLTANAAARLRVEPTAAQDVHPIVSLRHYCLLGGAVGRRLLKAGETAPLMKGGQKYLAYTLTGSAGELTVEKSEPHRSCMDTVNIKPSPEIDGVIAIGNPQWNPMPRVPQSLSTTDEVYSRAVAAILRRHGIRNPKIKINKVLRIDLEGDGVDEVLVSATHYAGGVGSETQGMTLNPAAGDYSLIFVRKVIRGRVQTIFVEAEYHPKAGRQELEGPPNAYDLTAVLDINGDGRMEIIIDGGYYEGSWATVYSIKGNKAQDVLWCGCGA